MITDIWTVMLKECKEFLHQRGSAKGTLLMMFIPALILGIMVPLQIGSIWVKSPISMITISWVPMILVIAIIADSFAGERERHTLETLLASRLSERAILFGKICTAMAYALIITVLIVFLGLVTVNIAHGEGELLLFPIKYAIAITIFSFLTALLMSSAGILVSLKASTVRQAHQTLTLPIILLAFTPSIIQIIIPNELKHTIGEVVKNADPAAFTVIIAIGLFTLDVILLKAAMSRFKRAQMILE